MGLRYFFSDTGLLAETARRKAQRKKADRDLAAGAGGSAPDRCVFEIEWATNGQSGERRKAIREEFSAPLVAELSS
jgi:transposase